MVTGTLSILIVFTAVWWSRLKLRSGRQWRQGLLEAAVLVGAGTIFCTELLGLFHGVRAGWISLVWALADAASLAYLWQQSYRHRPILDRLARRVKAFSFPRMLKVWRPLELSTVGLVLGATGMIAWLSPPSNFDSMTYQLPRVMHWFQQGTLEHYPTSNVRQLAYGPGAAYWQVQLWALFDGDLAANLPQWVALAGCVLALSLWLPLFFDRRAVPLALVTAITLPMALLQASSTQTDLLVGCWLLIAAVLLTTPEAGSPGNAALGGLALGLAVVTKPSALLFVAPLAVLAFLRIVRTRGLTVGLGSGLRWVLVSLLVCLPHFSRNYRWFGKPLGNDFGTVVESMSFPLAAANSARWLALNIPSMSLWGGLARTLESAGIDPNQPEITFSYCQFAPPSPYTVYRLLLPDEDFAAYTTTLLLIALLALASRTRLIPASDRKPVRRHPLAPWLAALLAMFVLNIVVLKWQIWGNRLLLPWALFTCPVLVAMTGAWRLPWLRTLAGTLLLLQAIFVLSFSLNRPLVPLPLSWRYTGAIPLFSGSRTARFFAGYNSETIPVCQQLVALIREKHWRRIGLAVDENYPEYPLWRAMHEAGLDQVEFYHVNAAFPPGYHTPTWPPLVDGYVNVPSSPLRRGH